MEQVNLSAEHHVRMSHIDREIYSGYPVDPDTGDVDPNYVGTCIMDGEPMPCMALQALDEKNAQLRELTEKFNRAIAKRSEPRQWGW